MASMVMSSKTVEVARLDERVEGSVVEALQEAHRGGQHQQIGERHPGEKERRCHREQWPNGPPVQRSQCRGDEGPELPEQQRQPKDQGEGEGDGDRGREGLAEADGDRLPRRGMREITRPAASEAAATPALRRSATLSVSACDSWAKACPLRASARPRTRSAVCAARSDAR
jgi:hypothetical protein